MSMRTPLVLALLMLATFAAAATPTRALAQTASASIGIEPGPASIPAGVDTLLSSTYTLRNTGATAIQNAQLAFQPSNAEPIPDAYFFFREWVDGVEQPSPGVATIFDAGDIAPGAAREIRFQIIVRSARAFAADAVLVGAPGQREFARRTVRVPADATATAPSVSLLLVPGENEAGGVAQYRLRISNASDDALRGVAIEVAGAGSAPLTSSGTIAQFERDGPNAPISAKLRDIAPREAFETTLTFESRIACAYLYPAVLVRAQAFRGGQPGEKVASAIAAAGASLNCTNTGGDARLPATGSGPAGGAGRAGAWPMALLALGAAMAAAGATLRRRRGPLAAADMA